MAKKGQIAIFLIFGVVLIILAGLSYRINNSGIKASPADAPNRISNYAEMVKLYAESCIKLITDEALFSKIGMQGGYIAPNGDVRYSENRVPAIIFQSNAVPVYIDGAAAEVPSLDDISLKISNYISAEFTNCFDKAVFEGIGLVITPLGEVKSEVSINEEDVSVALNYPISVKSKGNEAILESYRVGVPIRLKYIYESAVGPDGNAGLLKRIKDAQLNPPNAYTIVSSDCPDSITNIYLRDSDDGQGKIIRFVDFSTFYGHYSNSYIFQFAVKGIQVNGGCAI